MSGMGRFEMGKLEDETVNAIRATKRQSRNLGISDDALSMAEDVCNVAHGTSMGGCAEYICSWRPPWQLSAHSFLRMQSKWAPCR